MLGKVYFLKMMGSTAKDRVKLSENGLAMDLKLSHLHRHDFNPHGKDNQIFIRRATDFDVIYRNKLPCYTCIWEQYH